jgi:hypothetical protein
MDSRTHEIIEYLGEKQVILTPIPVLFSSTLIAYKLYAGELVFIT